MRMNAQYNETFFIRGSIKWTQHKRRAQQKIKDFYNNSYSTTPHMLTNKILHVMVKKYKYEKRWNI